MDDENNMINLLKCFVNVTFYPHSKKKNVSFIDKEIQFDL